MKTLVVIDALLFNAYSVWHRKEWHRLFTYGVVHGGFFLSFLGSVGALIVEIPHKTKSSTGEIRKCLIFTFVWMTGLEPATSWSLKREIWVILFG